MKSYTYGVQEVMDFMGIAKSVYRLAVELIQSLEITSASMSTSEASTIRGFPV